MGKTGGKRKTKKVRKHRGIVQTGGNKGKLRKWYKYSGKKLKNGKAEIIQVGGPLSKLIPFGIRKKFGLRSAEAIELSRVEEEKQRINGELIEDSLDIICPSHCLKMVLKF